MILKVLGVFCVLIILYFAIAFSVITIQERSERKKLEKEKKENEERAAEIITEANKNKADARTGDHKRDINYMASKLHDLATR